MPLTPALIRQLALAKYPDLVDLTLKKKTDIGSTSDSFSAGEAWKGRPRDATLDDIVAMNVEVSFEAQWWELIEDGQTVMPAGGSRIVEADGSIWVVKIVLPTAMRVIKKCFCIREYNDQ
jgi:hypothetical protein